MSFTLRLKNLMRNVGTLTDNQLSNVHEDLNRTAIVLHYGANDRVLNLCNETIAAVEAEIKRRREARTNATN